MVVSMSNPVATETLNATVTPFEDEQPVDWAEYVADRLADLYPGAEIDVTYSSKNRAFVGREPLADFADLCVGWWEELCSQPDHPAWR